MIFTVILVVVLVLLGIREYRKHQELVRQIPNRIHVNGTRGKSSVTRLITGGLQGGGIKALGKTTGTKPCYITPSGKQVPISRIGKANIIEQVKVVRRAVGSSVDALVVECMAVLPGNQRLAEEQMIHSTVGVITNVRADHLDEMGPTITDVARSLANTIPYNGTFFTCEHNYFHVFQEIAHQRNTTIHRVTSEHITNDMMKGFTYLEHKDNVALALAVCSHHGIPDTEALIGMQHVIPDPGVLRIYTIEQSGRELEFVNAFAANDPDSYVIIWQLLKPFMSSVKKVVVIVNCRKDRIQRTESLAELITKNIYADHIILVGELTTALEHRAIALGLPSSKLSNLHNATPEDVFEHVLSLSEQSALVIGIGNIVGFGEQIVTYFTNRGKEYAY
jgi:poly-gamma-glutamate synthase PgsB/CapB